MEASAKGAGREHTLGVLDRIQPAGFAAFPVLPLQPPAWMEEHLEAWRGAFRAFGANPKKTPCSVEALWKRMQKNGSLPAIDPVVDLYNALSIRFGACFGGDSPSRGRDKRNLPPIG